MISPITQTYYTEEHLICFEKHSLGENYPNRRTVMTGGHKVFFMGYMMEAYKFVNKRFRNVRKVKYNGDVLYNVLLENYDTMRVNNLLCETLHPDHIIAKIYNSGLSDYAKEQIFIKLDKQFKKNEKNKQPSVTNHLTRISYLYH